MSAIDSEQFRQICDGVWLDRATILTGRGTLSGEAALVRAVYWRLCKVGGKADQSINDHTPLLDELLNRYRDDDRDGGR